MLLILSRVIFQFFELNFQEEVNKTFLTTTFKKKWWIARSATKWSELWKKQIYSVEVSDSELNWIDFNERKRSFLSDTIKLFDNRSRTKHSCLVLMKSILSEWESNYWTLLILFWLALAQYRFLVSSTELIEISCASHLILQVFCSFNSIHSDHSLKTAFISAIKIHSWLKNNSNHFFLKV